MEPDEINAADFNTKVALYIGSPTAQVILVGGNDDGYTLGMRFNILGPDEYVIRDPDTEEVIGNFHPVVAVCDVVEVQDHISICLINKVYGYPDPIEPGDLAVCISMGESW